MSEHFDGHSPLRGWTTKQIADYVASVTGDETPISLVWNWQKRTESLEKGDPRRFPDPIGDDERGQKVFNPLKVIEWLETNKKVAGNVDVHPLLLDLVSAARGVGITKRWLEEVLASFLDADRVATPARGAKGPDLVVRGKSGDLSSTSSAGSRNSTVFPVGNFSKKYRGISSPTNSIRRSIRRPGLQHWQHSSSMCSRVRRCTTRVPAQGDCLRQLQKSPRNPERSD